MLIGIEASRANRLLKTGVEWYAYEIIQHLKKISEAEKQVWLLYGNESLGLGLEKGPRNWHERRLAWPPKYFWTQIRLSAEIFLHAPDVLFVPAHVLPRVIPQRSVVTIHDIGFHRYPQLYPERQRRYHEWSTRDILRRADRIITVSFFSKQELVDFYSVNPDKIHVTHLGINHERYYSREKESASVKALVGDDPYFIYVGRIERKKNIRSLIQAFRLWRERTKQSHNTRLLLLGMFGEGSKEILEEASHSSVKDHIIFCGYVSEEEKSEFLSNALALVHPSWYEGFGFTPLEAMACGCPVICSLAGSLTEVVGIDHALFFQPGDIETLADHLAHLARNESTRKSLRERGLKWVKRYTWEETARKTLRTLTEW